MREEVALIFIGRAHHSVCPKSKKSLQPEKFVFYFFSFSSPFPPLAILFPQVIPDGMERSLRATHKSQKKMFVCLVCIPCL